MFQNKTNKVRVLSMYLIIFMVSSAFADQSCNLTSDQKAKIAMAYAWKDLDKDLKKPKFSIEWSLSADSKTRFSERLERRANAKDMNCGFEFESDLLLNPKNLGVKNGIKRYREIFLEPNKAKPELYSRILNSINCPTSKDLEIQEQYIKAQQTAMNNLAYIIYHRLVAIKGESARHTDDLEILGQLKMQIDSIKPEVIRIGADLEFLKRAESFGNSLETSLKTKPEVLCKVADKYIPRAVDKIYGLAKSDGKEPQVK